MSKLKINSVIEIKRMLQQGYRVMEIARETGINRTTVGSIKSGKSWSNVQIDDDGNYIVPEVNPDHYPIEYIDKPKSEPDIVMDSTTQYRIRFIRNYFKRKIVHAKTNKDRSYTKIEPAHSKSRSKIFYLWGKNKHLFKHEYDDFISFIMMLVSDRTMTFKPDCEFDWSKVEIPGESENLLLHGYLTKIITHRIEDYANKINNVHIEHKNGEIEYVKNDVSSIHKLFGEEEKEPLSEFLSEDSNLFALHNDYYNSPLIQFLKENMNDVLSDTLIAFIDVYKLFANYRGTLKIDYGGTYKDVKNKPFTERQVRSNFKEIRKRVYAVFDEDNWSIRKVTNRRYLDVLQGFYKAEDRNVWLNDKLSNSEYISNLIHDNLSVGNLKHINKCLHYGYEINSDVMSEIERLIDTKIKELGQLI